MLRVEGLSKKYGDITALNKVSLFFKVPEIFSILGPSGSGKTTLLRTIVGLERPDKGRILIDEKEVSTPKKIFPPSKRRVSMIFQNLALWPHMTVRKNIEFVISGNGLSKKEIKEKTDNTLKCMHLEDYDSRYPHELSGGERQRLAISRAMVSAPVYLCMDEPFNNLDPLLIQELKGIILQLKNDFGVSVIYVTHHIELALILADRVAILNKGVIEQMGEREEIIHNPQSDFIRKFFEISSGRI